MRPLYSVTATVLTPLIRGWLKRRANRGKEDPARMGERFGFAPISRPPGSLVWLHAASVGEAQSVLTLVRAMLQQSPTLHVLITTGTVTSAALIAQQKLPGMIHQFVPVDTPAAVRRFLNHWQPDLALWVESELWPQMIWQTHARGTPMLLINARMSASSAKGWARWPRVISSLLNCFAAIYASSAEDAARYRVLGATVVEDVGNLKYDAGPLPIDTGLLAELTAATAERRVFVAASTHGNEEQMIADIAQQILQQFPGLLLILIPRHAARGNEIAADLRARGYKLAQRSKAEAITSQTLIYLADTMGELGSFYRLADLVFIGGSLVAVGGHNPLEPARLSCAIVTGPHIHNFAEVMQKLAAAHALMIAHDKEALTRTIAELLRDDSKRLAMAENAVAEVANTRGALSAILTHVATLLPARQP